MKEIELISQTSGSHYLIWGMDSDSLSSFGVQIWVEKFGRRAVDWLQNLSLGWIAFMGGDLWIFNQPESIVNRATFFGEKKDVYVGVVANQNPNTVKVLDSLGIKTDSEWEVTSVTIPKTLNYPNGMSSRIPAAKFKKREGFLRAEFMRNELSSSGTASVLDLMKGRNYGAMPCISS